MTGINSLPAFAQSPVKKTFTVTIDAGHGGKDPGAVGKKASEKNLALKIALRFGQYIENEMNDVSVHYTRKTDVFIPLYERAKIATQNKSDLFISIHVNAVAKNKANAIGTSTYVMGYSRSSDNMDLVMQENKAILLEKDYQTKYDGFDPTSPESYIIFNNLQNNNLSQSLEVASIVQDQFRTVGQRKDMGVHQGNFVVLWGCAKPSILIETGFISNLQEESFLISEEGQETIARSIYMAFRQYKESVDSRIGELAKSPSGNTAEKDIAAKTVKPVSNNEKKTVDQEKKQEEVWIEDIPEKKEDTVKEKTITKATPVSKDTTPAPKKAKVSKPESETAIEYRVQILASVKKLPLNAKDFKGVKNLEEIKLDGYYKYMSKPMATQKEAQELRRKLSASFKGAFIVAFKNGERIQLNK